ncbi:PEP-CTERM sorting domain-containing protein [Endozoicomonas sp. SM1973]|uniref:PEP-CTERM sorting domain-containing protein n=1 Tax=Spartinivicinus marinus TaxID=2994442 RepID=A0A853IAI9_9GAMM|nr:PEP-CTERM sorting domain-containing protein [Spartinivicinus marinus]MCX4026084.1 PEP-CTERM sorting domain-containing protein [Spartinivicinus marinus]NYZ66567.1 PEP-CTERM sorting domain-containing protein [Spartinivicinus marinus]
MNKLTFIGAAISFVISTQAMALYIPGSKDITINDGNYRNLSWDGTKFSRNGWYGPQEDNEVEPGASSGPSIQAWDLEAFYQKGNQLSLASGFDLVNGAYDPVHRRTFKSGDIFLSTSGSKSNFDYVLDINWNNLSYDVVKLTANSQLASSSIFASSGPWSYLSGGTQIESGTFNLLDSLTDAETGLRGGKHFLATGFDLSFLGEDIDFIASYTMQCGNDHILGQGKTTVTQVPLPGTLSLLGVAALGLFCRRK